jgi:hypothetical protein
MGLTQSQVRCIYMLHYSMWCAQAWNWISQSMEEMMEREAQQEMQWEIDDMAEGEPSC